MGRVGRFGRHRFQHAPVLDTRAVENGLDVPLAGVGWARVVVGTFDADLALMGNQLLELISGIQVGFVELRVAAATAILEVCDHAILVFNARGV